MKVINPYNYEPHDGIVVDDELLTEPDQAYSLRELLERAQNGTLPPIGITNPLYDDDNDLDGDGFNDDPTKDPNFDFAAAHDLDDQISAAQAKAKADMAALKILEQKKETLAKSVSTEDASDDVKPKSDDKATVK